MKEPPKVINLQFHSVNNDYVQCNVNILDVYTLYTPAHLRAKGNVRDGQAKFA